MTTDPAAVPAPRFGGIVAVWVAAALVGVAIGVLAPTQWRAAWLSVGLGGLIILAFAIQLAIGRSHGFIRRTALSALGALLVLAIVSAGFGLALMATG